MKVTLNPSGINRDINPAELGPDVWNEGQNTTFENGFASAAPGWVEAAPGLICKPLWLLPVFAGQIYYWIYAGNNVAETAGVLGVTDGFNHFDITPIGGLNVTAAGDWTGAVLNGIPVFNNPLDPPMFWDVNTANAAQILPDWPVGYLAGSLRSFKYHLIAMNIDANGTLLPDLVMWSSAADPGSIPNEWTAAAENEAGSFSVAATQGGIVDGGPMRDQFMVYKSNSSTVMQYIAGQFVFSNRQAFATSGILARNCWAELYGQHFVLTDGDFIRHNGQEVQSLIDGVNRNYLFNQMDPVYYIGAHLAISHNEKQLYINWPESGNVYCNKSLSFDMVSNSFGDLTYDIPLAYMTRGVLNNPNRDPAFDARTDDFDEAPDKFNTDVFNPTSDVLVFVQYDQQRAFSMEGSLRDGEPVNVYLQMLNKDLGDPQGIKMVSGVWLQAESDGFGQASIRVRIGTQMSLREPITWSAETQVLDLNKADLMAAGRFISLELKAQNAANWRLNGVDIDYEPQGVW